MSAKHTPGPWVGNCIARVPRPSKRNPFKPGSTFARQFDGMLKAYADGHRDVVRDGGKTRCMGNNMACTFWEGYDGNPPQRVPRDALVYACYRAGQAQRLLDDERGVFVPPKSNSVVRARSAKATGDAS